MTRFFVGVALALAALLGAYLLEGGFPLALLGLTAFLITFFVPLFGVLAVWSFRAWRKAWGDAFSPGPADQARTSVAIWRFSEFACYLAGVLGSLLVAPIYGVLFGYVCRILKARVEALTVR